MIHVRHGVGVAALIISLAGCATPPPPPPPVIDFRAELSRYGEWIVVAPYGRLWHPNTQIVGPDFVPYVTGGGWVYGAEGWTFETKWSWGQYPFHYGRWLQGDDLGWLWWPDQARGAAWVQWRAGDERVGWSPLPPEVTTARAPKPPWFYVKTKHLSARQVDKFLLKPGEVVAAHQRAEPLPATGPNAEQVRAAGGMERDPRPPDSPPPVVEPPPEPEKKEEPAPPPPPPPKKKGKAKRR